MRPFKSSKAALFLIFSFILSVYCRAAYSADFYSLRDQWEKKNKTGNPPKSSTSQSYAKPIQNQSTGLSSLPTAPPVQRTLQELSTTSRSLELELNQSLFASGRGIEKFVATEENLVAFEPIGSDILKITGVGIGKTFVHVWDGDGRHTFQIQGIAPKYVPAPDLVRQKEIQEKSRSFKLGYDVNRSAFYTGRTFRERNRTSMDMTHNVSLDGDTPYGYLAGHSTYQLSGTRTLLTDAQVSLTDGRIGPAKDFNLTAGDKSVRPQFMVFPEARVRGADVEHWNRRMRWETFYGREEFGIIGALTPGVVNKRTRDSFLGGAFMDLILNEHAKTRAGFFTGAGRSREDALNRRGVGVQGDIDLGPHLKFLPETDFDNERFAQKYAFSTNLYRFKMKNEFRDIDKKFQTLLGAPSARGEQGFKTDISAQPFERGALQVTTDLFRDRFVPNPQNPGYWNFHKDARFSFYPFERTSVILNYQDYDDTGRIGPSKQRVLGAQLNQQVDVFGHPFSLFSRFQNRTNNVINDSLQNYRINQLSAGFQTRIVQDLNFTLEQEWNHLEEPNIRRISHPRALTYTFDYNHRLFDTPMVLDARLRIRDEEDVVSTQSFMRGEDSTEVSMTLNYRESPDWELYATGSLTKFKPESVTIPDKRIEAQLITGLRYLYDTGFRWEGVGSFEGWVFKDLNGDGIRQDDEPGIPGASVKAETGQEAVTDENGRYQLKSVKGRSTVLTLQSQNIPYGYVPTNSFRKELPIVMNSVQKADFGLVPRSEITGIVYNDLNGNGRYDLTEKGVRKIKVILDGAQNAQTNILGVYTFSDVLAGEHTASLDLRSLPDGYLPVEVPKKTFTVFEGLRYELPFALKAQRAVTGRVFVDENGNGSMENFEKGLSGIEVVLGERRVKTDADGWYLFDELTGGSYALSLDPGTVPADLEAPAETTLTFTEEPLTISNKNLGLKKRTVSP